ncbi:MAG TPA: hypothetical protein VMU59_15585 [Caulobacteraceae bacterium]|nr:hypothetical protein [Caulobacteraceae bacterium]
MTPQSTKGPPFAMNDALIDEAAGALDIAGRLEGPNGLLLLDVTPPRAPLGPELAYAAQAAVGLHREIQDDDDLSDIEEALEDPLRADDQRGIDEACDLYRRLLASRLKALLLQPDGGERLAQLQAVGQRP